MESSSDSKAKISIRYFPLKEGYVFAQLSTQMSGAQYQALTGITPGQDLVEVKKKGRAMILCLDKSGSMAGRPFDALKQGAAMVGKTVFEGGDFQHFVTLFYDQEAETVVGNQGSYEAEVNKRKAGGSTNFVAVFKAIEAFVKKTGTLSDVSIIFFTDG